MDAIEAAKNALECVLEAKKDESIVIFFDDEKMSICEPFAIGALKLGLRTHLVKLKTEANVFRREIPKEIKGIFTKQRTDIFINLLRGTREETPFRIELTKMETQNHRARLSHCPGITLDMLTDGALALTTEDHKEMQDFARSLIENLSHAVKVQVTNPAGTNLLMSVKGRPFFTDTVLDWKSLRWMNMPTGEVIVAPEENSLEGKLVCDMAVGGIGPIRTPIQVTTKNGEAQHISSSDSQLLKKIQDSLKTDERANIIGEFAFGINPKARFVEEFLEAEKMLGTIHLAFGNNSDMPGGKNPSKNHMDLLVSKPTVRIVNDDNSSVNVVENGTFKIKK